MHMHGASAGTAAAAAAAASNPRKRACTTSAFSHTRASLWLCAVRYRVYEKLRFYTDTTGRLIHRIQSMQDFSRRLRRPPSSAFCSVVTSMTTPSGQGLHDAKQPTKAAPSLLRSSCSTVYISAKRQSSFPPQSFQRQFRYQQFSGPFEVNRLALSPRLRFLDP